jgi:hypothetical protein
MQSVSLFSITNHLDEIAVYEKKTDQFQFSNPDIEIKLGTVADVNFSEKLIVLQGISYLCFKLMCVSI